MKILITGTPGVGKSTLSKRLCEKLNYKHYELSSIIIENNLYTDYNKELDTLEFKTKDVKNFLKNELKEKDNYIIDTHTVKLVKNITFDHIFILTLSSDKLYKRLKARNYNQSKITENLECEIFKVIEDKCLQYFSKLNIQTIDTDELTEEHLFNEVIYKLNK